MIKLLRNVGLSFFILTIIFITLFTRVEAFSINSLSPVTFLQRTTEIIVNRVSDIIVYLINQKNYILDYYNNSGAYSLKETPSNIEQVSDPLIKVNVSENPISVSTSTLPKVTEVAMVPKISVFDRITSVVPGLISRSNSITREESKTFSNGSQILNYTNRERLAVSLKPLQTNSVLDIIASLRVDDLFANQYFEHESPDGKSAYELAQKIGYQYLQIGENLAMGDFSGDQGIVTAWMESPGHRSNILNEKYTELGVSLKEGIFNGEKTIIAVQIFARPLSVCKEPNKESKALIDSLVTSNTRLQTEALVMYNNLNIIKNDPKTNKSFLNQKIQEYNYLVNKMNDAGVIIKKMIDSYNIEVGQYNFCINS